MGARGPQRGWKKPAKAQAAAAPGVAAADVVDPADAAGVGDGGPPAEPHEPVIAAAPSALPPAAPDPAVVAPQVLSAADRVNPSKLEGEALRNLAHARGMARSQMVGMSDAKLRVQLHFLINRQYETEAA